MNSLWLTAIPVRRCHHSAVKNERMGATNQDGPGSAPTLWFRGLADEWSVD